jgi:hypothetical protein
VAKTTVYIPEDLLERARTELPPDRAISAILQEALVDELDGRCSHEQLVCAKCRRTVAVVDT